ncbi:subtilisin-like serine protease, partial [Tulasnella sp. 418]
MSFQVPFHEVRGEKEEGSYIIKLKADANKQSIFDWMSLEHSEGGSVTHDYNQSNFYHGFAARCNQELLTALRNRSDIEYIAEDAIAYVGSTTLAKGTLESDENVTGGAKAHVIAPVDLNAASLGNKVEYDTTSEESKKITQDDATWGLHRISHKGAAQKPYKYVYPESAGDGATIFVLDTGVYIEHSEFEGRASHGPSFKGDPEDKNGHGTHVAGTAIGKTYGAAKKANVISVKVHDDEGKGQSSTTIAGIDWVVFQTLFRYRKPTIMNMSFGHHVEADDVTPVDHAVNM